MPPVDCHDSSSTRSQTAGRRQDAAGRTPLVALVGPPNSGKTTIYNRLTGLRQKVANYPGVTVEKHVGQVRLAGGRTVDLVDLPGVHNLSGRTLDERVTLNALHGRIEGLPAPDAIILIVDMTRLETQLMLCDPVLEIGVPTLLVLNMVDEFDAGAGRLDDDVLSREWRVEVVRTSARTGAGMTPVREFMARIADLEAENALTVPANGNGAGVRQRPGRSNVAIQMPVLETLLARRRRVQDVVRRAGYVAPRHSRLDDRLDALFLHPIAGPLVFLLVVAFVFQAIFSWAVPLMDGVDAAVTLSGEWLAATLPDTWFRSLLVDGIWSGVGAVVVFLPQILILFLFLCLLEDSGYMARAAVIADRSMRRVGLQGRSFLPLLSGYACAVPAILAARTVQEERDRLATIFVTPFMTCSARLPVYTLLIAAFIPDEPVLGPFLGARALTMFGLYALGTTAAIVTAFLLRRTLLPGEPGSFVIELPPYRRPTLKSVALRLWDRAGVFLKRAGTIILSVTVALWILTQVPRVDGAAPPLESSVLGAMGRTIEPVIEPLGLDWRFGVGLISSLAAREVIVGTLGTIYGMEDATEGSVTLREALQRDLDLGAAVALLVFFVFALQCTSTLAVMRRETAGWRWPAIQFTYMLCLAWVGAYVANLVF